MFEPEFKQDYEKDTYIVSATCVLDGKTVTEAEVPGPAVFQWRRGAFVQDAFPDLTPSQREALFISGVCGKCYDEMAGDDE